MNIELPRPAEWSAGARSETGYKRNENQDRMSRISTALGDAYIVSDGMGGHKGGALAAQMTVDALVRTLAAAEQPQADVAATIRQAFIAANSEVHQRAYSGDPETHAMGATGLLLLALRSSVIVAHVGDSRAYLVRDGKLRLLTRDHTRVQRMIDAGMLTEEQAESHPDAGVLERAIGHQRDVEVEVSEPLELEGGDEILLCSDGLTSYVERAQIEAAVSRSNSPAEQVDELISLALAAGGFDNVTVQVIRYEGGMNERKRQILTYQLAFLPLVAVVAAATAFGVDYMNRSQVEAAPASVAKTPPVVSSPAPSKPATAAAPTVQARQADDAELLNSLGRLKDEVTQLSKRVEQLEKSKTPSGSALNAPATRGNSSNAKAHAKAGNDSPPAKRASDSKSKSTVATASGASVTAPPAGAASGSATAQSAAGSADSKGATTAQALPSREAGASAPAQSTPPASPETRAATPDAAAKAGPDVAKQ